MLRLSTPLALKKRTAGSSDWSSMRNGDICRPVFSGMTARDGWRNSPSPEGQDHVRLASPGTEFPPVQNASRTSLRGENGMMVARVGGAGIRYFFGWPHVLRLFIPSNHRHSGAAKRNPEPRAEDFRDWIPGSRYARPGKTIRKKLILDRVAGVPT